MNFRSHFFCVLLFIIALTQTTYAQDTTSPFREKNNKSKNPNVNDRISVLENSYYKSLANKDTAKAVIDLITLSNERANNAQYGKAYDGYWEALSLADRSHDSVAIALTYHGLGWLYSIYRRSEKATDYFNLSLEINKRLKNYKPYQQAYRQDYYALLILYRKELNLKMARTYLDSSRITLKYDPEFKITSSYIDAEEGYIVFLEKQPQKALDILLPARTHFEKDNNSYLIILDTFLGDIYKSLKAYPKANFHYQEALMLIEKYGAHLDLKPELYENLSKTSELSGDYLGAYRMLQLSKNATEDQFGSRSNSNRELLEIKDQYRATKEKQTFLEQKQRLEQLEREKKIEDLKSVISLGTLIFLFITGLLFYRHLRAKHKIEKQALTRQQELEIKKGQEILEIKNKELTTSTLRIIEKEELLSELKGKLGEQKKNPNADEINKIMKSIDSSSYNNWEEFEARFSSVNESFYHTLSEQFPSLSAGDKKICALIKLNFSSKDMSRLLGISTESVHTTRYRLRKKLDLSREVNLSDFIQGL